MYSPKNARGKRQKTARRRQVPLNREAHLASIRRRRLGILFAAGMLSFFLLIALGGFAYTLVKPLFIEKKEGIENAHLPSLNLAALGIGSPKQPPSIDASLEQSVPFERFAKPETPLEFLQSRIDFTRLGERDWLVGLAKPTSAMIPLRYDFDHATPFSQKLLPLIPEKKDQALSDKLSALVAEYPASFVSHIYVYDPGDDSYAEINGYDDVAAASVIKLPILASFFQKIDQGALNRDSRILYQEYLKASGSGDLQFRDSGDFLSAMDVATHMIQVSDNTSTNLLISALGGSEQVNEQLHRLGLRQTFLRNWLPDLEGSNKISMYEMATLLYNMDRGFLLTPNSRYDALNILRGTHNRRLLVEPLPGEALVAHKTGDIGTALGDSGIVFLPQTLSSNYDSESATLPDPLTRYGDYVIAIQVERPYNDYTAKDIIQRASRIVYDHIESKRSNATTIPDYS
ncbi:MAG: serine hydrolase [Vampirovibrionales bacterium]|nr:serine hydrolase [Vampirovibrionales bacterium]